jgi:hypothetical protein
MALGLMLKAAHAMALDVPLVTKTPHDCVTDPGLGIEKRAHQPLGSLACGLLGGIANTPLDFAESDANLRVCSGQRHSVSPTSHAQGLGEDC